MAETLARMQQLAAEWYAVGDRRALFADAYSRMTQAMHTAVLAREFADTDWVQRLLDRFADYYFVAVDCQSDEALAAGRTCPEVWREAFDACRREDLNELQLILLGINAHINHDLAFALADVLTDWEDLGEEDRARRLSDHGHVNEIIERTVDLVQGEVLNRALPLMAVVDAVLGRVDEWLFARIVEQFRENVWEDTVRLLAARTPEERLAIAVDVHGRAQRLARVIAFL